MLAGSLITGRRPRTIYDYDELRFTPFSGTVERGRVSLVDLETSATITGARDTFFNSGTGAYVQMRIEGKRFSGYDGASGHRFHGDVKARRVTLADDGAGASFKYSL